jgi:hypothetical protein
MKLIDIEIDWMEAFANHPSIKFIVDKYEYPNYIYEEKQGLYYAETDGFASFFSYTAPGEGFAGRHFDITMKDGSKKTLIGPWSSRAGCLNKIGFGPVIEGSIQYSEYGHVVAAVRIDLVEPLIKKKGIFLFKDDDTFDLTFIPSMRPDCICKPTNRTFNKKKLYQVETQAYGGIGMYLNKEQLNVFIPKPKTNIIVKKWVNTTLSNEQHHI